MIPTRNVVAGSGPGRVLRFVPAAGGLRPIRAVVVGRAQTPASGGPPHRYDRVVVRHRFHRPRLARAIPALTRANHAPQLRCGTASGNARGPDPARLDASGGIALPRGRALVRRNGSAGVVPRRLSNGAAVTRTTFASTGRNWSRSGPRPRRLATAPGTICTTRTTGPRLATAVPAAGTMLMLASETRTGTVVRRGGTATTNRSTDAILEIKRHGGSLMSHFFYESKFKVYSF